MTATAPPLIFGRYQLLKQLGEGGMASVFMALDPVLERTLAIKMIRTELSSNDVMMLRFVNEAKVYASLGHANVVTIYDYGVYSNIQYIAMEYVDGPNLSQLRSMNGVGLSETALYAIIHQVAEGLAVAHSHGIIHRDIKPENIMVTTNGVVKITDFGIAHQQCGPQMTSTGAVLGSPNYMAPEQLNGEKPTPATDIYALGAVLYFLCTGSEPYKATSLAQLFKSIAIDDPVPVCKVNPAISPELGNQITAMMSKAPADRTVDTYKLCEIAATWLHRNGIASGTMLLKREIATIGFRSNSTLSEGDTDQVYKKVSRDFAGALTTAINSQPSQVVAASPASQSTSVQQQPQRSRATPAIVILVILILILAGTGWFVISRLSNFSSLPSSITTTPSLPLDTTLHAAMKNATVNDPATVPSRNPDTQAIAQHPEKPIVQAAPRKPQSPVKTDVTTPDQATNYQDLRDRQKKEQFDFMLASVRKGDVPGMTDALGVVSEYLSTDAQKSLLLTEAIIAAAATNEQAKSMLEIMRYMRIASLFVLKRYQLVTVEAAKFLSMYPNSSYSDAVRNFESSAQQLHTTFGG